jgi:hypothetical protein
MHAKYGAAQIHVDSYNGIHRQKQGHNDIVIGGGSIAPVNEKKGGYNQYRHNNKAASNYEDIFGAGGHFLFWIVIIQNIPPADMYFDIFFDYISTVRIFQQNFLFWPSKHKKCARNSLYNCMAKGAIAKRLAEYGVIKK